MRIKGKPNLPILILTLSILGGVFVSGVPIFFGKPIPSPPPISALNILPKQNNIYDGAADREYPRAKKAAREACGKDADLVKIRDGAGDGTVAYYFKDPDPKDVCEPEIQYSRKTDTFSGPSLAMEAQNIITMQDWKISGKEAVAIALKNGGSDFLAEPMIFGGVELLQSPDGPVWQITFYAGPGGAIGSIDINASTGAFIRKGSYIPGKA